TRRGGFPLFSGAHEPGTFFFGEQAHFAKDLLDLLQRELLFRLHREPQFHKRWTERARVHLTSSPRGRTRSLVWVDVWSVQASISGGDRSIATDSVGSTASQATAPATYTT